MARIRWTQFGYDSLTDFQITNGLGLVTLRFLLQCLLIILAYNFFLSFFSFCIHVYWHILITVSLVVVGLFPFFFLSYFFLLEGRFTGKRDIKIYHLLVHSPNGHDGSSWAYLEPGARSFCHVSHAGAGFQGLGLSFIDFPGNNRELNRKWSS